MKELKAQGLSPQPENENGSAERMLREERDLSTAVLETTGALVVVLDVEGRIVRFNRAAEALTGYSFAEIKGQRLWDLLLLPEEAEPVRAVFDQLWAGQFPNRGENHWVTRNGERRLIAWSNTAITDERGQVKYVIGTGVDITERKQAEDALRETRAELEQRVQKRTRELQQANDSLRQEIAERKRAEATLQERVAFEGLVTAISARFINLPPEDTDRAIHEALQVIGEFVGVDRSYVFLFSADQKTMGKAYEWCAEGISPQHPELPLDKLPWLNDRRLKQELFCLSRLADLPCEAEAEKAEFLGRQACSLLVVPMSYRGAAIGFLGLDAVREEKNWSEESIQLLQVVGEVLVNALERKKAGEALRRSEQRFRVVAENASDLIYEYDITQDRLHWFGDVSRRVGYQAAMLPGTLAEWQAFIHPEDRARALAALEMSLQSGSPYSIEYRVLCRDGSCRYWSDRGIVLLDEKEQPYIVLGANTDVTEQVLAYQTLEQRVKERTRELTTLLEISRTLTSTLELETLLGLILDQLHTVVNYTGATIFSLEGEEIQVMAHRGPIPQAEAAQLRFSLEQTKANREVIRTLKPVLIADVLGDSPLARAFQESAGSQLRTTFGYIRSWMGIPLLFQNRLIGMLSLDHSEASYYGPQHAGLALAFASQVAVAIENARLYAETRRRADEMQALFNVQQALASPLEQEVVLQLIADEARRLTDTGLSAVYLVDGEDLALAVVSGEYATEDFVETRLPITRSAAGLAVQTGRPILVTDAQNDPRVNLEVQSKSGAQAFLAVPLFEDFQPTGIILVANKESGALSANDEKVLVMLASGAAIQLKNARLYQQEQIQRQQAEQRRQVAEGLRDVLSVLNSSRPLRDILEYIIAQAIQLLGADAGVIYRFDRDADLIRVEAVLDMPPAFQEKLSFPLLMTEPIRAVMDRQPYWVPDFTAHIAEAGQDYETLPPATRAWADLMQEHFCAYLDIPLVIKNEVYGFVALMYYNPRQFTWEEIGLAVILADQAALALENARLFQAEQRRVEQFRVINEASGHIASLMAVDQLLNEIVQLVKETLGYYIVGIALIEGDQLVFRAGAGSVWENPAFEPPQLKIGQEGITGWVAQTGQPLLVPDVSQEPRYYSLAVASEVQAEIAVPLLSKGKVIGVMHAQSERRNAFDESDLVVLQSLANQAAIAIENARLYEQAQEVATLEERQRLARELHDSVTQSLYSVTLYAEAATRLLGANEISRASEHLNTLRETAQEALREMRLLIFELRPPLLEQEGLVTALRTRLEAVEGRAGLRVRMETEGTIELPMKEQKEIYRIAQEALNNVLKHAHAKSVVVRLCQQDDMLRLDVVDDGQGFDPTQTDQGWGLPGMAERVKLLQGTLALESAPGHGTHIRVAIPLNKEGAENEADSHPHHR